MRHGKYRTPAVDLLRPCYKDPKRALRWLEEAFGFEPFMVILDANDELMHSEMRFGGGTIMVGSEWSPMHKSPANVNGLNTQTVHVQLKADVDAHCDRARKAGAKIAMEPTTQFYGDRTYRAVDPEGHIWSFGQTVQHMTSAEWDAEMPGIEDQDAPLRQPVSRDECNSPNANRRDDEVKRAATRLAAVEASLYSSRIGSKPPQNMRCPSNGILSRSGCMRWSSMIFGQAASRVALSGHSTNEKTTFSPSLAFTARLKSVTLPSGTSSPQASTTRVAPYSLNTSAALAAISR